MSEYDEIIEQIDADIASLERQRDSAIERYGHLSMMVMYPVGQIGALTRVKKLLNKQAERRATK